MKQLVYKALNATTQPSDWRDKTTYHSGIPYESVVTPEKNSYELNQHLKSGWNHADGIYETKDKVYPIYTNE